MSQMKNEPNAMASSQVCRVNAHSHGPLFNRYTIILPTPYQGMLYQEGAT